MKFPPDALESRANHLEKELIFQLVTLPECLIDSDLSAFSLLVIADWLKEFPEMEHRENRLRQAVQKYRNVMRTRKNFDREDYGERKF